MSKLAYAHKPQMHMSKKTLETKVCMEVGM